MKDQIDYTNEWRRLGYQEGMGSASFLPPPAAEYVRAYHMTSSKYAVQDIQGCHLKVARFSEVNDPFELLGLSCRDLRLHRLTKEFKDLQNKKIGLLSFCQNWTNPVLWSHYALRHRGIILGFDLKRSKVEHVNYSVERIREVLPDDRDPDVIPKDIVDILRRTKSRDWQYEQELRMLIDLPTETKEGDLYFWPFSEDMRLAEVILGPRCDQQLSTIASLVAAKNPDAVVFKARLAYRSFRVVLDGRTKPKIPRNTA